MTGAAGTTEFVYDGDKLLLEYDGFGSPLSAYVHGPGTDDPLVWNEIADGGGVRYLRSDHQGSIVALADRAGNSVGKNSYDAWGIPGAGNQGRFGYTGQTWIPELGLWYYKARFYSAILGRFMQTDQVGYKDQINLYAYVGNDPVNSVDPTGDALVYKYNNGTMVVIETFDNHTTTFSDSEITGQESNYAGKASNGTNLITRFVPGADSDAARLTTNPALDDNGEDRSHTVGGVRGRDIELAPNAPTAATPGHELGHVIGAGDQYVGGRDANNQPVKVDGPGHSIMKDLKGPANQQSIDEIVRTATSDRRNTVIECTVTAIGSECR